MNLYVKIIFKIYKNSKSCIKNELGYFGIETIDVDNYIEAIKELAEPDINHKVKCKYYATWIMMVLHMQFYQIIMKKELNK